MTTQPFVLILLSAAQRLRLDDGTEVATGFWAEELVAPWQILRETGWRLQVATPGGVPPLVDAERLDPATLGGDYSKAAYLCAAVRQMTDLRTPIDLDALTGKDLDTLNRCFHSRRQQRAAHGPLSDTRRGLVTAPLRVGGKAHRHPLPRHGGTHPRFYTTSSLHTNTQRKII